MNFYVLNFFFRILLISAIIPTHFCPSNLSHVPCSSLSQIHELIYVYTLLSPFSIAGCNHAYG